MNVVVSLPIFKEFIYTMLLCSQNTLDNTVLYGTLFQKTRVSKSSLNI
jgi:hypothetical protein